MVAIPGVASSGSLLIDVNGNRLDAIFLTGAGATNDHYTILKGPSDTPAAPSNLVAATVSSSSINLTWADNSTNELGFSIERSLDGSSFAPALSAAANATSALNTGLSAGVTYYYRVRATNATATSAYSSIASATTPPTNTTLTLTTPPNGASYPAGATVAIAVSVISPRTVTNVAIFANGALLAATNSNGSSVAFGTNLLDLYPSSYAIYARAIDSVGTNFSGTNTITATNVPILAALTAPTNNQSAVEGATVTLSATATGESARSPSNFSPTASPPSWITHHPTRAR